MILVWKDEIDGGQVSLKSSEKSVELNDSYVLVSKSLKKKYPHKKILSIFKDDNGLIQARLGELDQYKFKGAQREIYFPSGAPFMKEEARRDSWTDWVLKLHRQLLLGGWGKYILALVSLFLLFILTSGAFIIPFFKGLKDKKGARFTVSRLHQKIGALSFSWLILITFTGLFLALNSVLIGLFLKGNLEEQRQSYLKDSKIISHELDTIVSKAKEIASDYEVDFIAYPDTEFSLPGSFAILLKKQSDTKIAFIKSNQTLDSKVIELPWYLKALVISEPLHFGNYGGMGLKFFWSLFGIFAAIIPLTGFSNYYYRKLKRRVVNV